MTSQVFNDEKISLVDVQKLYIENRLARVLIFSRYPLSFLNSSNFELSLVFFVK